MSGYAAFLERKDRTVVRVGREADPSAVHSMLHEWQARITSWAVDQGRAAIWADTGMGKTFMQIEWARLSADRSLIVAPLAVCHQTVAEAAKLGITARYARNDSEAQGPGMYVTNYERVAAFDPDGFGAVVLDEASILKQSDGKTRTMLIEHFAGVRARLACTATPAPNDIEELTSQAEFLGIATRTEMLAAYFVHDDTGWRPKGHAGPAMFRWMSKWAVALRKPSDLGWPDDGYILPGLEIVPVIVHHEREAEGQLFATDLGGVGGRAKIRKDTLAARVDAAVRLVEAEPDEPWLLWCGLNAEAEALARAIPGSVNVHGGLTAEEKADHLLGFANGDVKCLITKPSIAAFGLNWQICARMAFVGLSDSYESYYQAIRRCYRYGQTRVVRAHIVLSDAESQIASNVARKERDADLIHEGLVAQMRLTGTIHKENAA